MCQSRESPFGCGRSSIAASERRPVIAVVLDHEAYISAMTTSS